MYDYGGLRTRVNPLTNEVEYDDTPEPVAEPVSSGASPAATAPSLVPRINVATEPPASREARNQAGSVLAKASGKPFIFEMADPMQPLPAEARAADPTMAPTAAPAATTAPPIVPRISPAMSTAEVADPHAMAELQADPVQKRNLFSKILAGLTGAYYGSQGRLDLAEQVGQAPRLARERQVKEIEGRIRQGNSDLIGRQNREIAIGRQTAEDADRAARLEMEKGRYAHAQEMNPYETATAKANATYAEARAAEGPKPNWQVYPNAQGGYDRIDPDTGRRETISGSSAYHPPATKTAVSEAAIKNQLVAKFGKPANTRVPNPQYKGADGRLTQQGAAIEAQAEQLARNNNLIGTDEGQSPSFDALPEGRKMALIEAAGKAVGIPVWTTLDQTPEWAAEAERLRSQGGGEAEPPADFLRAAAQKYGQGSAKYNQAIQIWQQQNAR